MHFIDTNVLVGAADRRDDLHERGKAILKEFATGRIGSAIVSDFVLDETLTLLGRRQGVGPKPAIRFVQGLLSSPRVRCIFVDAPAFKSTLEVFDRYGPTLNFTDASTVAVMASEGCESLYSNDEGFDRIPGMVRRISVD